MAYSQSFESRNFLILSLVVFARRVNSSGGTHSKSDIVFIDIVTAILNDMS